LYEEAWSTFYDGAHMRRQLAHAPAAQRRTLLQMYLWYKTAIVVDRYHPMMTGFVRLKPRRDRRPGYAVDSPWHHARRRVPELVAMVAGYAGVLRELRRVWRDADDAGARAPATERQPGFLRAMFARG